MIQDGQQNSPRCCVSRLGTARHNVGSFSPQESRQPFGEAYEVFTCFHQVALPALSKFRTFFSHKKQRVETKLTKAKHAQRFKAPPCRVSEMYRLKPWRRQRARSFAVLSHSWTGNGLGKERDRLPCQQCAKPPKMIAVNDGKNM